MSGGSSGGYTGFRPVYHGVDFPEGKLPERPQQAVLQPDEPPVVSSTGFTQVHVSGLPADCEDDVVEAKLREVLQSRGRGARAIDVESGVNAHDVADIVVPSKSDTATTTEAETGAPKNDADVMPGTETGVLEKDAHCTPGKADSATAAEAETGTPENDADVFVSCTVVRDKNTLACKGYCFLAFATFEKAEEAVQILSEGVEVAGAEVQAQLSRPKASKPASKLKKAPAADPNENLSDLNIRRKRYQGVSKHASYRHEAYSSGRVEGGGNTKTRNSAGRLQGVAGTRGGKSAVLDDGKASSRSGFATAF